jgi:hypothetical protein
MVMSNGSVLDLVGMRAGEPAASAIARSVDVAQHVKLVTTASLSNSTPCTVLKLSCHRDDLSDDLSIAVVPQMFRSLVAHRIRMEH